MKGYTSYQFKTNDLTTVYKIMQKKKTAIYLGNVHTVTQKSNGMDVKSNGMDSNGMENFLIYQ